MCLYMTLGLERQARHACVMPQSPEVRMPTEYYDFELPLLCTVCLNNGRFVPLKNFEPPLHFNLSKPPVHLVYPQLYPCLRLWRDEKDI